MAAPQSSGVVRLNRKMAGKARKTGDSSMRGPAVAAVDLSARRQADVGLATGRASGPGGGGSPEPIDPAIVGGAIQTAIDSLHVLERHAHELAAGFRRNRIAEANRGLADLMQSTHTLLVLAAVAADITGTDLTAPGEADRRSVDEETRLAAHRLIECEETADWSGLADTLDHALVPAFARWREAFSAMGAGVPEPPPPAA